MGRIESASLVDAVVVQARSSGTPDVVDDHEVDTQELAHGKSVAVIGAVCEAPQMTSWGIYNSPSKTRGPGTAAPGTFPWAANPASSVVRALNVQGSESGSGFWVRKVLMEWVSAGS